LVAQILFLEYRWLVKPIVRMAAWLQTGEQSWRELAAYAPRPNEIGISAGADGHFRCGAAGGRRRAIKRQVDDRLSAGRRT